GHNVLASLANNVMHGTAVVGLPFNPYLIIAVILGSVAFWLCATQWRAALGEDRSRIAPLLGLALGCSAFFAAHIMANVLHAWYYTPLFVGFYFVISRLCPVTSGHARLAGRVALYGVAGLTLVIILVWAQRAQQFRPEAQAVRDFIAA